MGGQVIVTEADKIYSEAKSLGLAEGRAEGRAEGLAEKEKITKLIQVLLKENNIDDIDKAITYEEYCKRLYKKYNIS